MKPVTQALVFVAALMASTTCMGWGSQGHRLVGYVADAELTPKTRIAVRRIMEADSLASVANWMDEVRDTPEGRAMQRWHFVTIKVCGDGKPSCKNGNCATGRIEWARDALRTGPPQDALRALRVLVHLIGDVHQPLHAADNGDYGGSSVTVMNHMCVEFGAIEPMACRLHTYWDTNVIKAAVRGHSELDAANAWARTLGSLPVGDSDRAEDWSFESNALAKRTAYQFEGFTCRKRRQSFAASEAYEATAIEVSKQQIAKAGKRLARILNAVFD